MLYHLTLNTGHAVRTSRSEVGNHVLTALRPVVDDQGGPIPGMPGWHVDLFRPVGEDGRAQDGAAFFQIADEPGTSKRPVAMAVTAWSEEISPTAWDQICGAYKQLQPALQKAGFWRPAPLRAPPVPWLAVAITPMIVLADTETVQAFGDLERCLAWALIEGGR